MLEIDPMTGWLGIFLAVLGGAVAAGAAFYVLGRRLERRMAAFTLSTSEREHARQLDEARQSRALEVKEELLRSREGLERELLGRRQEVERRQQTTRNRFTHFARRRYATFSIFPRNSGRAPRS